LSANLDPPAPKAEPMAHSGARVKIKLSSTGSSYTYHTTRNRRNDPQRLEIRKYDPFLKRHVVFKEEK
jgi:large subunit ribosomal protein L33